MDAGNPLAFEFPLWHNFRIPCIRPLLDGEPCTIRKSSTWEIVMATYIMTGRYSTDAIHRISGERTTKATDIVQQCGGKLVAACFP